MHAHLRRNVYVKKKTLKNDLSLFSAFSLPFPETQWVANRTGTVILNVDYNCSYSVCQHISVYSYSYLQ